VLALSDVTEGPLLSVQELAVQLRLSTKTVYGMARAGEIPAVRRPGKRTPWRFHLPSVLAALQHEAL
jgi:excisionase family DNA binding protein